MIGKWLVILPLLADLNTVTSQPITSEARLTDCCPCPESTRPVVGTKSGDGFSDDYTLMDCPCRPRADDAEASASILLPALRAMQPFVNQPDQKTQPKPLLQPEVGLASSVLETLRQATDEEYQEALARDATRSTMKLIESTLDFTDAVLTETPKNNVKIFLNTDGDDMDDNLPESSHVQETRCIHSPLKSTHKKGHLRISPKSITEVIEVSPKPLRNLKTKSIFHRNFHDMDSVIGASSIEERVWQSNLNNNVEVVSLKSNPSLLSLFSRNNVDKSDEQKGFRKTKSDKSNQSPKFKPKMQLTLKDLIDNLEVISQKQKSKVQLLKNYVSAPTQTSPLKFTPVEKYNDGPLLLKDFLKLKDVELIPQNYLNKNVAADTSSYPNLKLKSENYNLDSKGDGSNFIPIIDKNSEMKDNQSFSDIPNIKISQKKFNGLLESNGNEMNKNIKQNDIQTECMTSSENNDMSYVSSMPINPNDQDNFDYGEVKLVGNYNEEFSENCKGLTKHLFNPQLLYSGNQTQGLNKDTLRKEQSQILKDSEDFIQEESIDKVLQIELLENLDTPIEFDNKSFTTKSYLKNNGNVHQNFLNNENTLNVKNADTNINDFKFGTQNNKSLHISQENYEETLDDCSPRENFSKNSNFASENQSLTESSQEMNLMQPVSSEDVNSIHDISSDTNENSNKVSFKDLQDMSNLILSLSQCEPARDENLNMKRLLSEELDQINDDYDVVNTALTTPIFKSNSKNTEIENTPDTNPSLNANNKLNEVSDIKSNEKIFKLPTSIEMPSETNKSDIKKYFDNDIDNSEMQIEATELESQLCVPMSSSLQNTVENKKETNIITKSTAGLNDIGEKDNRPVFLNNVKSKLEGLFSTTEKVLSKVIDGSEDNANESSNIHPLVAQFDKFNNINKLQRTPHTLLSLPKLPGISLNSYKNKFAEPNHVALPHVPLKSDALNLLNFPSEISRPLERALDQSLTFKAFSDRLRSQTENTIQNVKKTLESTLQDRPTNTVNVLESTSNRHDEMKEKLEAIHLDLNDRFSSFRQSILDHFNVPPSENYEFQQRGSNEGLRATYVPKRKELLIPEASKLRNVNHELDFLPHRVSVPNHKKDSEISFMLPKKSVVSDSPRFRTSDRKPTLQNPVLYSRTTAIPSFIPRSKVLNTNIESAPRLTSETLEGRPSKISILSEEKGKKMKPLFLKSGLTNDLSEEPYTLSSSLSKINTPINSFKTNTEKNTNKYISIDTPVDKFKKTLLQRNQKSRNDLTKSHQDLGTSNLLDKNGLSSTKQESRLGRMKEQRPRTGSMNNDELVTSPTSHTDTMQSSKGEMGLRLVEPMKENVPYKCKLICYKD